MLFQRKTFPREKTTRELTSKNELSQISNDIIAYSRQSFQLLEVVIKVGLHCPLRSANER